MNGGCRLAELVGSGHSGSVKGERDMPEDLPAVPDVSPSDRLSADLLAPFCETIAFGAGDALRTKGEHYRSLYLLADGEVSVRVGSDAGADKEIVLGLGAPIGEIGFIRGSPASANVVATKASRALVINDGTVHRIQHEDPDLAIRLLRFLASTTEQRSAYNSAVLDLSGTLDDATKFEVLLCRDEAMLERALKLRYAVYCGELGRESPYADHDRKTITDDLDAFGHTFMVIADGEAVGTLRANLAREGDLGILEELYGMKQSEHHPDHTCICTKYITRKSHRGGAVAMKMLAAVTRYMLQHGMRECYIDCIPSLLLFYQALGFKEAAGPFHHYENGPSHPMRLDVPDAQVLSGDMGPVQALRLFLKARRRRPTDGERRPKS